MKTTLRLLSMLVAFIMLSLSVCTPLYAVTAVSPDTDGSAGNAQSLENATENEAVFEELQNFDTIVSERLSSAELATAVLDTSEIPAAMSGSTEAIERKDHVKRLFSEEKGLHSVVFQNRDDTTTEYIFSCPVKYVDENGNIRDKSTDIRVNSDNSGFAADDNTVRSYFSNALNDGICIGFGEYEVEFSFE